MIEPWDGRPVYARVGAAVVALATVVGGALVMTRDPGTAARQATVPAVSGVTVRPAGAGPAPAGRTGRDLVDLDVRQIRGRQVELTVTRRLTQVPAGSLGGGEAEAGAAGGNQAGTGTATGTQSGETAAPDEPAYTDHDGTQSGEGEGAQSGDNLNQSTDDGAQSGGESTCCHTDNSSEPQAHSDGTSDLSGPSYR